MPQVYGPDPENYCLHAKQVSAMIAGGNVGVAAAANLIPVVVNMPPGGQIISERYIEALVRIIADLRAHSERKGVSVVNMSFHSYKVFLSDRYGPVMGKSSIHYAV